MGFLLLGVDSLIACFAVGTIVSRSSWLLYATLFGICDAGGFLLGTWLHWSIPPRAVASCEEALAQFQTEALSAELDEATPDKLPGLRVLDGGND